MRHVSSTYKIHKGGVLQEMLQMEKQIMMLLKVKLKKYNALE